MGVRLGDAQPGLDVVPPPYPSPPTSGQGREIPGPLPRNSSHLGPKALTVQQIQQRIGSGYPEAVPIPGPRRFTSLPAEAGILVYPGLRACYGQMDVLERLRDAGDREAGSPGFIVLVPADRQTDMP